jgi:hypothetical protein
LVEIAQSGSLAGRWRAATRHRKWSASAPPRLWRVSCRSIPTTPPGRRESSSGVPVGTPRTGSAGQRHAGYRLPLGRCAV